MLSQQGNRLTAMSIKYNRSDYTYFRITVTTGYKCQRGEGDGTPWMEEPGRLPSMGSLTVGHDWVTFYSDYPSAAHTEKEMATHSSILA